MNLNNIYTLMTNDDDKDADNDDHDEDDMVLFFVMDECHGFYWYLRKSVLP